MRLEAGLHNHQNGGDQQVPEAGHEKQRNRLVDTVGDGVGGELQFEGERHGGDQRGGLQHADGLVAGGRDDDAHGLRQHDAAHDERAVHAQCLGRLGLAGVHGFKAGTHDFGQVGGLVQGQTNPCGVECGDHHVGVDAPELHRGERNSEADLGNQHGEQTPENELRVHRRAAEEPDEEPADAAQHRIDGFAHDGKNHRQDDRHDHGDHGELQGIANAFKHVLVEQVLPDGGPIQSRIGNQALNEHRGEQYHDHCGHNRAGALDRQRLDAIGDVQPLTVDFFLRHNLVPWMC